MQAKRMIERRMLEIYHEASGRGGKTTPEQNERIKKTKAVAAGLEALSGFLLLDEEDMASGDGLALGKLAMRMLGDHEMRAAALEEIASSAIGQDSAVLWKFALDQGLKPFEGIRISQASMSWSGSQSAPAAWIARALDVGSWKMAVELAKSPEGSAGVPTPWVPEPEPQQETGGKRRGSRASAKIESSEKMRHWHGEAHSNYWRINDPTLMAWQNESDGGKPYPAEVKRALKENGFGARFGEPAFDISAARLALGGSRSALAACSKAKLSPAVAFEWSDSGEPDETWRGSFPRLALDGPVMGGAKDSAAWVGIAAWIDEHMGAGFSKNLCARAAMSTLKRWERDDFREYGDRKDGAAKALAWLAGAGASDPEQAQSELSFFQGMAIGLAEIDRGKPRAEQAQLKSVMDAWSVAVGKPAAPRRALKA